MDMTQYFVNPLSFSVLISSLSLTHSLYRLYFFIYITIFLKGSQLWSTYSSFYYLFTPLFFILVLLFLSNVLITFLHYRAYQAYHRFLCHHHHDHYHHNLPLHLQLFLFLLLLLHLLLLFLLLFRALSRISWTFMFLYCYRPFHESC